MVKLFIVYYFWKKYSALVFRRVNILISAGHHWVQSKFRKPTNLSNFSGKTFLDSGGFQLVGKFGDYPFDIKEYVEYVENVHPDFFASLDYPCEGVDHPSPHVKLNNKERIHRTVENARLLVDAEVESTFIPVIQGYELSEYSMCIDALKSQGLLTDYMGVGSVCIRKRKSDVLKILELCKKETRAHLHVFGLNIGFLQDPKIRAQVDSFDTLAWMFPSTKFGRVTVFTGKRLAELNTHSTLTDVEMQALTLRGFLEYFDYLQTRWKAQQTLIPYVECVVKEK